MLRRNLYPTSTTLLACFLLLAKSLIKLVDNSLVGQLTKCHLFSDSLYGFILFPTTAGHLPVVSDRIAGFNSSGATRDVELIEKW